MNQDKNFKEAYELYSVIKCEILISQVEVIKKYIPDMVPAFRKYISTFIVDATLNKKFQTMFRLVLRITHSEKETDRLMELIEQYEISDL